MQEEAVNERARCRKFWFSFFFLCVCVLSSKTVR